MSGTKVFFSYSSADWVLAHLIIRIFEENGVECFVADRGISTGVAFDDEIVTQIWKSDLLIVLVTPDSSTSPWVHQEVGIARGYDIPVWPLAVDGVKLEGIIFRNQGFFLAKHSRPHLQLVELAKEIARNAANKSARMRPVVEQYVISKISRTAVLVDMLNEEYQRVTDGYIWRVQASFSSFAISDDPIFREYHPDAYVDLLVRERDAAIRLASKALVRIIVSPRRPHDDKDRAYLRQRFTNLIGWLEAQTDPERVRVVVGQPGQSNKCIFDRDALVEGVRSSDAIGGYQLTTVSTHGPTVARAVATFEALFGELWEEHSQAAGVDASTPAGARAIRATTLSRLKFMSSSSPW
jgi:hypothetical protein